MSTILFELGTEELPPKNLKTLRDALNDHVTQSLKDANIRFDTIKSFAEQTFEMDSALTDFKKVSDLSGDSLDQYVNKLQDLGSTVARTG